MEDRCCGIIDFSFSPPQVFKEYSGEGRTKNDGLIKVHEELFPEWLSNMTRHHDLAVTKRSLPISVQKLTFPLL